MKTLFVKSKVLIAVLLLTNISFSSAQSVVGYFDNSLNQAGTRITQLHWDKMTDFIFGFVQPDASGNLPDPTTLSHFNTAKTECAANGVNMHFSSGGATYSSIFNTIGGSAIATENFAIQIADLLQTHGLKGFDLDWEFPRTASEQIAQVNILKAIHDEFTTRGKRAEWEIAIAVGGETPNVGSQGVYHTDYCSANAFQYIDHLNIMSYDIGFNISGGDANHSSYADAQANMTDWVNKGCPISKIVLGVPFYARHSSNRGATVYTHTYGDLSNGDPATAFNSNNVGAYYYNGAPLLKQKVDYVMAQGGAGVMIWEVTYDRFDQYSLLDALADAMAPYQCSAPKPDLGADQSICGTSKLSLDGGVSGASGRTFTWKKDGADVVTLSASANSYSATAAGTYIMEVHEGGCSNSDEIIITGTLGTVNLGGPYDLCSPVTTTLNSGITGSGKTFVWEKNSSVISGATSSTYEAKTAGTFKVTVSASGCSSINGSATVTSSVPSADNFVTCNAGDQATLTASESVNWYSSAVSSTVLSTGVTYQPSPSTTTTYWMGGTGASSVSHTTMKTAFSGGWQADAQVYASKLIIAAELTIDEVYINGDGGNVVVNLVSSDGTTVVKTKTFTSVTGETALSLGWTAVPAGTYYLNAVGTTGNIWVDNSANASDHVVAGVITVEKQCYNDWSAPYGDAYVASANYGNFFKLKVTVGSSCDRVPVDVTINGSDPNCGITSAKQGSLASNFSVFPNPSESTFNVKGVTSGLASVYNTTGSLVEHFNVADRTVFGEDLLPGVYTLTVNDGVNVSTHKIVKQ